MAGDVVQPFGDGSGVALLVNKSSPGVPVVCAGMDFGVDAGCAEVDMELSCVDGSTSLSEQLAF